MNIGIGYVTTFPKDVVPYKNKDALMVKPSRLPTFLKYHFSSYCFSNSEKEENKP